MTKHDGVQGDSILIDQTQFRETFRQVRASHFVSAKFAAERLAEYAVHFLALCARGARWDTRREELDVGMSLRNPHFPAGAFVPDWQGRMSRTGNRKQPQTPPPNSVLAK